MAFTPAQTAACPVAAIQRQILAAMEAFSNARHAAFLDPDDAEIAGVMKDLWNKMHDLEEAATHEVATSKGGLAYHVDLLKFEASYITRKAAQCSPESFVASSGRVWALSEAIGQSIASMPDDAALNPLDIAPSFITVPPPRPRPSRLDA
jgi:hypothetical protein